MEVQFIEHPDFGGFKIYNTASKPVILASDVGLLLQQELNTESIKSRYAIHVSVYPNQDTGIYQRYWRGLNNIAPGKHFDYKKTRWAYVYEQTGTKQVLLNPLTPTRRFYFNTNDSTRSRN